MVNNPQVGLIFMIPGMNETLRVNGKVRLVWDADLPGSMAFQGKRPKLAIMVEIQEVFSHCPKAFMRPKLWALESRSSAVSCPSSPKSYYGITHPSGSTTWTSYSVNSTSEPSPCCISLIA
jgi:hypothetical protein